MLLNPCPYSLILRFLHLTICTPFSRPQTPELSIIFSVSTGNRKDALLDVLHLPVLRFNRLRSDVMILILILWLYLLSYAIEFIQVLLSILLFLLLFVHAITSGIVCAGR